MEKSKKQQTVEEKRVENAIRSLLLRFENPMTNYGCKTVRTKEAKTLQSKIEKRKDELAKDPELKRLTEALKKVRCDVTAAAKKQHDRCCFLLRKFQTRGITPQLLDEIDKMSAEEPVWQSACDCDDDV